MTEALLNAASAFAALLGSLLCLTSALGLARFPDIISRMHPASKPQSLGMLLFGIAVLVQLRTWHAVLAMVLMVTLQMMTVTLGSHIVARSAYRTGLADESTLVVDELARDEGAGPRRRRREREAPGSTVAPHDQPDPPRTENDTP